LQGLLGVTLTATQGVSQDGALVVGTRRSLPLLAQLKLSLPRPGSQGYVIRSATIGGHSALIVAAEDDVGVLYGVFTPVAHAANTAAARSLGSAAGPGCPAPRAQSLGQPRSQRRARLRRQSIWDWHKLPDYLDPRYIDYARANASLGINGTVLTNVNSNAVSLRPDYLQKAAALAGVLASLWDPRVSDRTVCGADRARRLAGRPIRPTPAVKRWWQQKASEIYRLIPDFGGFLVKANSEGQPGPQDYGRTHADGANMLAAASRPHGGIVMWRAFVYSTRAPTTAPSRPTGVHAARRQIQRQRAGAGEERPDRFPAARAVPSAVRRDAAHAADARGADHQGVSRFRDAPVYLGTLYEEVLRADTYARGSGSTVAKVVDGSLHGYSHTGIAGVANIGTDRNWSGSHFDQANWYAFGRLAWTPASSAEDIARDWVRMTFTNDANFVARVVDMMMKSRQAGRADYMTPLGLHHLMAEGHHYGPQPWFRWWETSGFGRPCTFIARTRKGSASIAA
jgi:alpha-glucuronidase